MFVFSMLVAAATATAAVQLVKDETVYKAKFVDFMVKYKKTYGVDEFQKRYNVFKANVDFIEAHNAEDRGFTVAMNEFGDLTNAEFKSIYNGYRGEKKVHAGRVEASDEVKNTPVSALPTTVDWVKKGAVTGIKNQGQCGSCWSFSTTGSVEGQHFLAGQGTLVGLSEQNLMDCSSMYGNMACDGGLMDDAFQYIIANNGIELESDYPYTGEDGPKCLYNQADRGACIQSYVDVASGNETALQVAVATVGPISVAIDASQSSFQFYESGVYYSYFCSATQLDHGVLAVGYGSQYQYGENVDYWLVKNSWGAQWGDQGFIKMIRNWDNNCGIATAASYPQITKTVC